MNRLTVVLSSESAYVPDCVAFNSVLSKGLMKILKYELSSSSRARFFDHYQRVEAQNKHLCFPA